MGRSPDLMPWPDIRADVRELRQLFAAADLTQCEAARAIGASQSQVSRILDGQLSRSTKTFRRLRAYLSARVSRAAGQRPAAPAPLPEADG